MTVMEMVSAGLSGRAASVAARAALAKGCVIDAVEKRGPGEFDVGLSGADNHVGCQFSARLDLFAISALVSWFKPVVARMTDYPDMAAGGDWSAVRDSSDEKITAIFKKFVLGE